MTDIVVTALVVKSQQMMLVQLVKMMMVLPLPLTRLVLVFENKVQITALAAFLVMFAVAVAVVATVILEKILLIVADIMVAVVAVLAVKQPQMALPARPA